MALTPLNEVLQREGTAFDQRLQQLTGMAESLKASKMRKQQMAQKLDAEKDLIQFRSDVQLQQKKDFYEDVTKPQQEAEALKEYAQQLKDSRQSAKESISEMQKTKSRPQYSSLFKYNLDEFDYDVNVVTDQEGQVSGYEPEVYYGDQKVPATEFHDTLSRLSSFGDELESVDNSKTTYQTRKEDGILYLGNDSQGNQIIENIKSDPEMRNQYFKLYEAGKIQASNQRPELDDDDGSKGGGGGPTSQSILNNAMPVLMNLRDRIGDETKINFGIADRNMVDDWSFLGIGEDTETREASINFNNTIGNVQRQINNFIGSTVPEIKDNVDLSALSDTDKAMIFTGEVDDEVLDQYPEERANVIRRMADMSEDTRQQYKDLVNYYGLYEDAYQQYIRTGKQASRDDFMLDLWNSPDDLSTEENFKKLLKPVSETERGSRMLDSFQDYLPSDPNVQFLNK